MHFVSIWNKTDFRKTIAQYTNTKSWFKKLIYQNFII